MEINSFEKKSNNEINNDKDLIDKSMEINNIENKSSNNDIKKESETNSTNTIKIVKSIKTGINDDESNKFSKAKGNLFDNTQINISMDKKKKIKMKIKMKKKMKRTLKLIRIQIKIDNDLIDEEEEKGIENLDLGETDDQDMEYKNDNIKKEK